MFKLMDKKISQFYAEKFWFIAHVLTLALSEIDTVLGETSVMATHVCSGGPNNHLSEEESGVSGHLCLWVQL